ncbi:hypothetical protein [Roseiflexus castenholzii]|uniref:Uncharacterized protein n=1 Tax=Roseiflexus castenholzii (strain DSM 13941 / HLO8) TaxID=383372 RepID=A7NMR9_ROSCS|nr:hypothetical protein [Roseiflexus castenholzii]ABU58840.1 conserved hypothetical protein [Roseiflexus castenholzii DSM 13941]
MEDHQSGNGLMAGIIVGAFVGAAAATVALRRRFPAGPGSDERALELPPPDDATLATARTEAAAIVARLRSAFPNLTQIEEE